MGKKILTFGDIEVEKHAFCQHKIPILINDIDISKTVLISHTTLTCLRWSPFTLLRHAEDYMSLLSSEIMRS